jgi:ubiquinone/menaquinone biosynthesis C-methylase UbiE
VAKATLQHGDFTGLAENYSKYRAGYAPTVLHAVCGLLRRDPASVDVADVGAGTGVWSRMLATAGFRSITAIEPNDDMREAGIRDCAGLNIDWRSGRGEATGLPDASVDLLTMASSFHWVDFDRGIDEFCRVLRPGGWFVALWNPRLVERNPLLADIEAELTRLRPDLRRVSSGRSGITETLADRLDEHAGLTEVVMIEGRHTVEQSLEQYLGAWRSVNDVRVQLGERDFAAFLRYAADRLVGRDSVETTYLTRAWAAQRITA